MLYVSSLPFPPQTSNMDVGDGDGGGGVANK